MNPVVNRVLLLAAAIAVTACSKDASEADPSGQDAGDVQRYSAVEFFETTSYSMVGPSGHAFSPDGESLLISSDESGVFNVYELPLDGSDPVMLTNSVENAMFAESWFPDDKRFLFTYDELGDELNHVIVRNLDGSVQDLTPGENLKAAFLGWSDDGGSFFLLSTERDPQVFDVYRYSVEDFERELIFENPGFQVSDISGDGRWLALDRPRTSADSDIYIVDLTAADPAPVLITEHDGNIQHYSMEFAPDSASLVYNTDEFGEFSQSWAYDLASGDKTLVAAADWDVSYVIHSASGRYRTRGVNADARTLVTIEDLQTGEMLLINASRGSLVLDAQ